MTAEQNLQTHNQDPFAEGKSRTWLTNVGAGKPFGQLLEERL